MPLSPVISTVDAAGALASAMRSAARQAALTPMGASPAWPPGRAGGLPRGGAAGGGARRCPPSANADAKQSSSAASSARVPGTLAIDVEKPRDLAADQDRRDHDRAKLVAHHAARLAQHAILDGVLDRDRPPPPRRQLEHGA